MNFILEHYLQLSLAIVAGMLVFLVAFTAPERTLMKGLILLIPFQLIQSQFASLNVVFVYMLAIAFLLKKQLRRFPLAIPIAIIIFAYLISYTQTLPATRLDHIIYLISVFSNFLMFYLVYNFVAGLDDWRYAWNILITLNVLVILYCMLQIGIGFGRLSFLGLAELTLQENIEEGRRLVGPFFSVAMTAEYFDIQILIIGYAFLNETGRKRKAFLFAILCINCALLVGTGNRGGLVSLMVGGLAFLFLFRTEIGAMRAVMVGVLFSFLFTAASVIMVKYSDFNVLYERVQETEFEGAMPVFREGWEWMWPRVFEKPIVGHGPRLKLRNEELRKIPGYIPMPYPHNAYMYIFYTLGAVGFLAYGIFVVRIALRYLRATRIASGDRYLDGTAKLGLIILLVSMVSEIRMEMFRYVTVDYQHYMFMLLAMILAFADLRGKHCKYSRPQA
jgi:O-antigen ligase